MRRDWVSNCKAQLNPICRHFMIKCVSYQLTKDERRLLLPQACPQLYFSTDWRAGTPGHTSRPSNLTDYLKFYCPALWGLWDLSCQYLSLFPSLSLAGVSSSRQLSVPFIRSRWPLPRASLSSVYQGKWHLNAHSTALFLSSRFFVLSHRLMQMNTAVGDMPEQPASLLHS